MPKIHRIANDALTYLSARDKENPGAYFSVQEIAHGIACPVKDHNLLRKALQRLATVHKVVVEDASKIQLSYKINVPDWNKVDPFYFIPFDKPITTTVQPAQSQTTNQNEDFEELMKRVVALEEQVTSHVVEINELKKRLDIATSHVQTLELKKYNGETKILENVVLPKNYKRVLGLARCRRNILLVGPAGCGKTYLSELVAKSLDLPFRSVSCTSGMSEAQITGRIRPKLQGKDLFQSTGFLESYENGGVFLFDEFDAADPNLLLVVNSALANGYCNVPNRDENPIAKQHPDFVCIVTANTFGRGANRMYSGRNQLDEATLDRFRIGTVECDYDRGVEASVCPDEELRLRCWEIRSKIEENRLTRIMSTRFIKDAYIMRSQDDWTLSDIFEVYFSGWTKEERTKVNAEKYLARH